MNTGSAVGSGDTVMSGDVQHLPAVGRRYVERQKADRYAGVGKAPLAALHRTSKQHGWNKVYGDGAMLVPELVEPGREGR